MASKTANQVKDIAKAWAVKKKNLAETHNANFSPLSWLLLFLQNTMRHENEIRIGVRRVHKADGVALSWLIVTALPEVRGEQSAARDSSQAPLTEAE